MSSDKLDPEQQRLHREALERWLLVQREVQLANAGPRAFLDYCRYQPTEIPTVTMPRDEVVRLRGAYQLAILALADFVGKPPQEMTQLDCIEVLIRKHYAGAYPERLSYEAEKSP